MFANRFTAFLDACALAGALKRNLLLTLAEAEFFRLRWSDEVLDETERAIAGILQAKGETAAAERARRARAAMNQAFEDARVTDYAHLRGVCDGMMPDPKDIHVVAAALKTQAAIIVTDNLKDFPEPFLASLNLDVRTPDAFLADTIALDPGRAVAAIHRMRARFLRPDMSATDLLIRMEAAGLTETVDVLQPHVESL